MVNVVPCCVVVSPRSFSLAVKLISISPSKFLTFSFSSHAASSIGTPESLEMLQAVTSLVTSTKLPFHTLQLR